MKSFIQVVKNFFVEVRRASGRTLKTAFEVENFICPQRSCLYYSFFRYASTSASCVSMELRSISIAGSRFLYFQVGARAQILHRCMLRLA
jgi:hypothetical protein